MVTVLREFWGNRLSSTPSKIAATMANMAMVVYWRRKKAIAPW